jgi:arylsulfatase A-like enzyme
MHTASISTFAERHSSWWFNAGFNETYNVGKGGMESGEEVLPVALDWIERNAQRDNWFLHLHFWDPHTPYRAPLSFGNPFENDPLPDWITEDVFKEHLKHVGPHCINEINMYDDAESPEYPRHPGKATDMAGLRRVLDGYDCGVRFADHLIGQVFKALKSKDIYEDMAIIITSDHGENLGELGLYSEHATADHPTCHIPMIIKWPGNSKSSVDSGFHYNIDICPTMAELLGVKSYSKWDGQSYAGVIKEGMDTGATVQVSSVGIAGSESGTASGKKAGAKVRVSPIAGTDTVTEVKAGAESEIETASLQVTASSQEASAGRPYLVLSQQAHVCQRSVRFENWIYIRTYHDGYHLFPKEMLFNVEADPHEQYNAAAEYPEVCCRAAKMLLDWHDAMMMSSASEIDPMWTVMKEGGPEHARGHLEAYLKRLEATGRSEGAAKLRITKGKVL